MQSRNLCHIMAEQGAAEAAARGGAESAGQAGPAGGQGGRQPGGGEGPAGPAGATGAVTITVNRKKYSVRGEMTARAIKELAGAPLHHLLIHVVGGPDGAAGGDDEPKADADAIRVAQGMRFRTVNSATFGSQAAAHLPPLLRDHIGRLESMGFEVEVAASDAIYVVIKDYPIPGNVWDRSSSDLLIMAFDTYPNAPLDMFWLDPPVSRRSGEAAGGTGTETRNGREWQSFSWHIGGWDPAHDNLVTYLDVVNDRLRRDA